MMYVCTWYGCAQNKNRCDSQREWRRIKIKKEVSVGYMRRGVWYGLRKLMDVKGIVK
jgi:hypothetical protein